MEDPSICPLLLMCLRPQSAEIIGGERARRLNQSHGLINGPQEPSPAAAADAITTF